MRPTFIEIDKSALKHNIMRIKALCPSQKIVAMVKANAYGCGIEAVVPTISDDIDIFGVACLEEAMKLRQYTSKPCVLFQGVFSETELSQVLELELDCVIHHTEQLKWLLSTPLSKPIRIWLKVNTGMNRLGFEPNEINPILEALRHCSWVENSIVLLSHMACADEPAHPQNKAQLELFNAIPVSNDVLQSFANSALILTSPKAHYDIVRPGLMLYGVSPLKDKTSSELNLYPVMSFISTLSVIHEFPANRGIGYSATWRTTKPTRIGVVAAGYGDGYPRHIDVHAQVWLNDTRVPIVGRVSMDMLTLDLSNVPDAMLGDRVELWGKHLLVEEVAQHAGTIPYELLTQVSSRVREKLRLC